MKSLASICPPVLSCADAGALEKSLLGGDEAKEWTAMQAAGRAIADAVRLDFAELGAFPAAGRVLVLVGKGHNGGDALIAAHRLLESHPTATAEVWFVFGERRVRPLTARAWREVMQFGRERIRAYSEARDEVPAFDLCLDGIFGFQFRRPVEPRVATVFDRVNAARIRLRAAVDLPSADVLRADFTYGTGSVKDVVLKSACAGRVRYLDLGFFPAPEDRGEECDRVVTASVLEPLRGLRPAQCDKRTHGHVFLLGGSRGYPGAILMSVEAAVRSGAGLVTAFVPESLVSGYASRLPDAIWVGWPETPGGGLALEGEHRLRERASRADALVIGPGLGREPETLALMQSIVAAAQVPLVIDADALQPDIVRAGTAPRIVTPHAGEFKRIAGEAELRGYAQDPRLTVVLKGPITRVCAGGPVYHNLSGGPVLARGGSGDVLSGLIGTQLAQDPERPLEAAVRAVCWHGLAADRLARARGQVAVHTTELLDYLGAVLREGGSI